MNIVNNYNYNAEMVPLLNTRFQLNHDVEMKTIAFFSDKYTKTKKNNENAIMHPIQFCEISFDRDGKSIKYIASQRNK